MNTSRAKGVVESFILESSLGLAHAWGAGDGVLSIRSKEWRSKTDGDHYPSLADAEPPPNLVYVDLIAEGSGKNDAQGLIIDDQ